MIKNCLICSQKFITRLSKIKKGQGIYCSKKCRGIYERGNKNPNWKEPIGKVCLVCEKEYKIVPAKLKTNKYCSVKCRGISKSKQITGENHFNWKGGKPKCKKCNKLLNWNNKTGYCWNCITMSDYVLRGEDSPQWEGGKRNLHKIIRDSLEYKLWRQKVFQRDNYICQICKQRGKEIHADHINLLSELIIKYQIQTFEDAKQCFAIWNINNGRTLCVNCHYFITFGKEIPQGIQWGKFR